MGRVIHWSSTKKGEHASENEETVTEIESVCPICQEQTGTVTADGTSEGWSMLPCGHRFGSFCIKHYLGIVADDRPSCPVCRHNAYHQCGHPWLPTVVTMPDGTPAAKNSKALPKVDAMVRQLNLDACNYCIQNRNANVWRTHAWGSRPVFADPTVVVNRKRAIWAAPFLWLRDLDLSWVRMRRRRWRRRQAIVTGFPVGPGPDPTGSSNDWTRPWMDTFPRAPDPQWQEWWKKQYPEGA